VSSHLRPKTTEPANHALIPLKISWFPGVFVTVTESLTNKEKPWGSVSVWANNTTRYPDPHLRPQEFSDTGCKYTQMWVIFKKWNKQLSGWSVTKQNKTNRKQNFWKWKTQLLKRKKEKKQTKPHRHNLCAQIKEFYIKLLWKDSPEFSTDDPFWKIWKTIQMEDGYIFCISTEFHGRKSE
jgi:hypothetical protein